MAPFFTPEWGDIPAKRWRIHPRAKPVAFCCRGEEGQTKIPPFSRGEFLLNLETQSFRINLLS